MSKINYGGDYMKILLLSDSHGSLSTMLSAVKKFGENADIIVHCGDAPRGEALELIKCYSGKTVVCVRGNCDWGSDFEDIEYFTVCGKKIMVTHGHLFNAKFGLDGLYEKAVEEDCDMVFFGHTHYPTDTAIGDVRLINPGSCGRYEPSCATVEIDDKGNVLVNHLKID